jgi:hypothetical protein
MMLMKCLCDFRMKSVLGFSTPYSKWSEEIITLSDEELVLKHRKIIPL